MSKRMMKKTSRPAVAAMIFAILSAVGTQAALAEPNCAAELYLWRSSNQVSEIEYFTAHGATNEKARRAAENCINKHVRDRWDRKTPKRCTPAAGVYDYGLKDLKQWIENRACEKGWAKGKVSLVLETKGGAACRDKSRFLVYEMQPRYCE